MAMTDAKTDNPELTKEEVVFVGEHLDELRAQATEGGFLRFGLVTGLILGLIAHVLGYVLRASMTGEPFALLGDLLYALGLALWTGVVVAFFVQVVPEIKRRQLRRYLDAYEATRARRRKPRLERARR
jgi:hypothetical protein